MLWSQYIQNAHDLDATRQILLNTEWGESLKNRCKIQDSSKVLEIGCGTGCFTEFISKYTQNVDFYGLDRDNNFIKQAKRVKGDNRVHYICCSAYDLPFKDNEFDTVFSFTFFNCVEDPYTSIKELKRAAKKGATISSITAMSFDSTMLYGGNYPSNCKWNDELKELNKEYMIALEASGLGAHSISKGISTAEMPQFFCENGLKRISIFPLGYAFSLSDASIPYVEKETYIKNLYLGQIKRLDALSNYPKFIGLFPKNKIEFLKELLSKKKNFWLDNLEDNSIWEWVGGSMLLVTGVNEK